MTAADRQAAAASLDLVHLGRIELQVVTAATLAPAAAVAQLAAAARGLALGLDCGRQPQVAGALADTLLGQVRGIRRMLRARLAAASTPDSEAA